MNCLLLTMIWIEYVPDGVPAAHGLDAEAGVEAAVEAGQLGVELLLLVGAHPGGDPHIQRQK